MTNVYITGGSVVAMVGKDCVAIASDLRLGNQSLGLSNKFEKVYNYGHVYLGLTGLATDAITLWVYQHLRSLDASTNPFSTDQKFSDTKQTFIS